MTTKTINGKEILFVQVTSDAEVFFLDEDDDLYARMPNHNVKHIPIKDNEGNSNLYIIGLASNLTEDEWKEIAEVINVDGFDGYVDYTRDTDCCAFADTSGQSLLQSLNLNLETTLIIEKK